MIRKFGRNDVIFLSLLAIICIAAVAALYLCPMSEGASVTITVNGDLYGTYSLSKDQEIDITNEDGDVTNILTISDGKADMTWADCPDKLCVKQADISRSNENIVCLPNKVVVTVESSEESDLDSIAK